MYDAAVCLMKMISSAGEIALMGISSSQVFVSVGLLEASIVVHAASGILPGRLSRILP